MPSDPLTRSNGGGPRRQWVIHCPCGHVISAQSGDQAVGEAQAHAADVHELALTDEQARDMLTVEPARPSD